MLVKVSPDSFEEKSKYLVLQVLYFFLNIYSQSASRDVRGMIEAKRQIILKGDYGELMAGPTLRARVSAEAAVMTIRALTVSAELDRRG